MPTRHAWLVDVPVLREPLLSLYFDSDVENMSDGWDDHSVYGFVHSLPVADGHGPLHSLRYETRNSGLFFLAATVESLRLTSVATVEIGPQCFFSDPWLSVAL